MLFPKDRHIIPRCKVSYVELRWFSRGAPVPLSPLPPSSQTLTGSSEHKLPGGPIPLTHLQVCASAQGSGQRVAKQRGLLPLGYWDFQVQEQPPRLFKNYIWAPPKPHPVLSSARPVLFAKPTPRLTLVAVGLGF